ncbi:acetylornithine aminotransferase [Striga asiatica]|uniref:Acetylornithine aminotransferase n=1 Tax=Striga asiatica TaxID=4170 RepID=A0A5A7QGR1_STRAF|nr:acetylornithine aminotransferase [Striga asiatica]
MLVDEIRGSFACHEPNANRRCAATTAHRKARSFGLREVSLRSFDADGQGPRSYVVASHLEGANGPAHAALLVAGEPGNAIYQLGAGSVTHGWRRGMLPMWAVGVDVIRVTRLL